MGNCVCQSAVQSSAGHYEYGKFVVLLLKGLNGDTKEYKEQLSRNGILQKATLVVENNELTVQSVNSAIIEAER